MKQKILFVVLAVALAVIGVCVVRCLRETSAISGIGPLKAMAPVPFVARLALGADAAKAGSQVKSLLPKDEGCGAHETTEWDVQTVSGADVYLSIGLPFEAELLKAARQRNPRLRVVPLDEKCRRIEGNPYVWMSGANRDNMEAAANKLFGCKKIYICGSPNFYLPFVKRISQAKLENYAVAILHPAFAYECGQYGVKTVAFDEQGFSDEYAADTDGGADPDDDEGEACEGAVAEGESVSVDNRRPRLKAAAAEIKAKDITLILALPSQQWIGDSLADLSQAKVAYVDLFGGDGPLDVDCNLLKDILVRERMKEERAELAEEERELATLSPVERRLEDVHIPQIGFYAPATVKHAAEVSAELAELSMELGKFLGRLSSWAKICNVSQDTASREINALVAKDILRQEGRGRSTHYLIQSPKEKKDRR